VDDNRDYADSVRELIEISTDWRAEAAYGVTDGIQKAKLHRPDAVLLDLEMPPHSGFQAVDAFEQAFSSGLPKIVAVSGNAHLVDAASNDRRLVGASLKPVDPSLLVRWLAELAAGCAISPR
jgi:two-component system nitrate/nitrite response regulator NarL